MDQKLLNVMVDSLRRISRESLIDQAFLQVVFLRDKGYDIVRKDPKSRYQQLSGTSVKHLMELVIRQKKKIQALEDENNFLKGLGR